MAELRGLPPGRSGRMWVRRRLTTARRGAALLDRKLRILRAEQTRLRELTTRTGHEWDQACAEAERWLLRAAMIGGERELRLSTAESALQVRLEFQSVMGVRYPASADLIAADPVAGAHVPGTAAIRVASPAYLDALAAGVRHAAATTALRQVNAEVAGTSQRLRAISDRWIPRLEAALADVTQRLDETERDETTRLRWAAGLRGTLQKGRG